MYALTTSKTAAAELVAANRAEAALRHSEFRDEYHDTIRASMPNLLARYLEMLYTDDDPEVLRKALDFFGRTVGTEVEKKIDPTANMPVFNIVIGTGGAVQITQTLPDTPEVKPTELALPPPTDAELDDELKDLINGGLFR